MEMKKIDSEELYLAPEKSGGTNLALHSAKRDKTELDEIPKHKEKEMKRQPKRIEEVVEQRGENFKVFHMDDGTEQVVFSPSPVHVFDDEKNIYDEKFYLLFISLKFARLNLQQARHKHRPCYQLQIH